MQTDTDISPYLRDSLPESAGRVLLARGFAHYCCLHWGLSGSEIARAFGSAGDERDRDCVLGAASLLGGLFARGAIRGWARPLGGGEPQRLKDSAWELDEFSLRFATGTIDPKRPFDRDAAPTHWIFADLDDWNAVVEASVADVRPRRSARNERRDDASHVSGEDDWEGAPPAGERDRLIRMPEVEHRTGLSRATIYRRIEAGRFPKGMPLSSNVTVWRDREVDAWVRQPG